MKTICFNIDAELFTKLKVQVAKSGMSMQDYMARLIREDMYPSQSEKLSEKQLAEIRCAAKTVRDELGKIEGVLQNREEEDLWSDEDEDFDTCERSGPIMSPMM